jgi:hypothetical protein
MRFKTTIDQVAIAGGFRQDKADGTVVYEPVSRFAKGRNRGSLYVLVEVSGPARGRSLVADRLAELVGEIYYSQRGSVTAALREAIREVNRMLSDENKQSMPDAQWSAGISCAVLRSEDLFIAQAGPAALYVAHGRQVTRFPDISPWLDRIPLEDAEAGPLGERHDVHVDLFHTQASENDTILLVNSSLAGHLSPQVWPRIMTGPSVSAVLDELSIEAKGSDLSALAVRLNDEGPVRSAAQPPSPARMAETKGSVGPVVMAGAAQGQVATKGEAVVSVVSRDDERPPSPPSAPVEKPASSWMAELRPGERARSVGMAMVAGSTAVIGLLKGMMPTQDAPRSASAEQIPVAKPPETKPRKQKKEASVRRTPSAFAQRLLIGIAIAIPIVVAGLVTWTVIQRGEVRRAEVDELWLSAQSIWQQSQGITDPAELRASLTEANQFLDQLLAQQPDHAEALDLKRRITSRLEESSQVRRVPWGGELKTYPGGAKITRVVVEGVHVFVMDRSSNQVYHHQLDEFQKSLLPDADTVLVKKGNRVEDVLVADLIDMTWMPAGNGRLKAALVILESNGTLLEYDPVSEELIPMRMGASETWQYPQLVGGHSGRFYLLDPTANRIWRYSPTPDGYGGQPDDWLKAEVDLAGVRDMAIADSIFLLYADGAIQKLSAGSPDTFDITDWDTPPQNPTAIFTRPPSDTQWVYLADPGNKRIVQSGKDGSFKRQFLLAESQGEGSSDALASVTSLFVDEIGGRAFFLSGDSLYMIILPSD